MKLFVNANANFDGNGTELRPFRRINEAAKVAKPGDEVLVAPGRRWKSSDCIPTPPAKT